MPRATEWRRTFSQFFDAASLLTGLVVDLAPGETLTRVIIHWQVTVQQSFPLAAYGDNLIWGLRAQPANVLPPTDGPNGAANTADWMWWEGASWSSDWLDILADPEFEFVTAPRGTGVYDIRSQRAADPEFGSRVFWQAGVNIGDGNPILLFGAYEVSALVLLPAT